MDLSLTAGGIRLLLLVGGSFGIGGMSTQATQAPEQGLDRFVQGAVLAGLGVMLLATGLESANIVWTMADGNWADACAMLQPMFLSGQQTSLVFWTRLGVVLLLAGGWVGLRRAVPRPWWLLGGVALATSMAMDGHAADQGWGWPLVTDTAHIWSAMTWLGGLLLIWLHLVRHEAGVGVLRRFSAVATIAYPVAVLTGAGNAWLQVSDWSAIGHSEYGLFLIAKATGVCLVLGMASYVRQIALPHWIECGPPPQAHRRVLLGELALGLVILALSSLLSQSAP